MNNEQKKNYIAKNIQYNIYKQITEESYNELLATFLPNKIYKYRRSGCKAYFEDYIRDNLVYVSAINEQDDKLEGITPSTVQRISQNKLEDVENYYRGVMYRVLCSYLGGISRESFNIIHNCYSSDKPDRRIIAKEIKKYYSGMPYTKLTIIADGIIKGYKKFVSDLENNEKLKTGIMNINNANEQTGISAFSEVPEDDYMWAHYADNFKGYCIEYDLTNHKKDRDFISILFPVIYEEIKNDDWLECLYRAMFYSLSKGDLKFIEGQSIFMTDLAVIMCTKLIKWKEQYEWRILGEPNKKVSGPQISSIIVGDKISFDDFQKVKEYCSLNNYDIKIVKMDYLKQKLFITKLTDEDVKNIEERKNDE